MNSLRSRVVLFLLRYRHWLRLQPRRRVVDEATSIPKLRERVDRTSRSFGKMPPGITIEPVYANGVPAEWIRGVQSEDRGAILYFHGGGYVMGSCNSHRTAVAKFVAGSGLPALVFDYRLAPEHPYPAALDDAMAVYRCLQSRGIPERRIVFAGDSAGGGLALATLLAVRDCGMSLPAGAAVLSPWTDLTCSGASYRRPDPLAPAGSWHLFAKYYAGPHDRAQPLISPLFGRLDGLPPLLIHVGDDESMLDDSITFADKARAAGVDVRLEIGRGMVHCYPVFAPLFPEATRAHSDLCAFLRARISA